MTTATVGRAERDLDPVGGAVELFKALASPIRLGAILELAAGPRCVHELSDALATAGREVSQPLLSQHLKVLRDVGLVTSTRLATEVTYELIDEHVAHIVSEAVQHAQEVRP
jgi:ArsR family transcriptional regulator, zinc-responsive transcriptional repressor